MSIQSLGEPINGTANLYAWGGNQILKLYGAGTPQEWVDHVARVDRALHQAGLPVPAVGETLEIEGQLGQVYERIEGETMVSELFGLSEADGERIVELAHVFAEVQARTHLVEKRVVVSPEVRVRPVELACDPLRL